MKKPFILLIFLATFAILFGTAASMGWFGHKKLINPEISPVPHWKEKRAFVDACTKDSVVTVRSSNDPNRSLQICSCLADKIEAKYPDGMTYQEAKKDSAFDKVDGEFCFK